MLCHLTVDAAVSQFFSFLWKPHQFLLVLSVKTVNHNDTGHKASSVRFIHILPAACPSSTAVMGTADMEQKWDESGKEMEAKVQNGVGILVKMFYSM